MESRKTVGVIGLGYVGLPLAVALTRSTDCWGLDIDARRVDQLRQGHDRTGEVETERLTSCGLHLTADAAECPPADVYIITVPTPVDAENRPDLGLVLAATRTVAGMIDPARKPIVVYESTVYPGVTEDLCGPEIEKLTGLKCGEDFFLGYSPERINPGDKVHTVEKVLKIVSGQNEAVTEALAELYGKVTSGGIFKAASIKAAEAAKVMENTQRDINIAFMNEIAQVFERIGLSIWDVLDAARTKWNFLPFHPGLVGGHCIGVDPYYLSHLGEMVGAPPRILDASRETNNNVSRWLATSLNARMKGPGEVLVLGLTFKENVPDLRNSKVADLIGAFAAQGHSVRVHDPLADPDEARHEFGVELVSDPFDRPYDLIVLAVPHAELVALGADHYAAALREGGTFADFKRAIPAFVERYPERSWTM